MRFQKIPVKMKTSHPSCSLASYPDGGLCGSCRNVCGEDSSETSSSSQLAAANPPPQKAARVFWEGPSLTRPAFPGSHPDRGGPFTKSREHFGVSFFPQTNDQPPPPLAFEAFQSNCKNYMNPIEELLQQCLYPVFETKTMIL